MFVVALFKKIQKILISIEIVHFMYLLYYLINLHVFHFLNYISKANKILFNFFDFE